MTVLSHSGTLCPVIGSECILSAVSLQDVMKTLVRLAWCIRMSCDGSCYTQRQYKSVLLMYVRGIVLCFCMILLEMGVCIFLSFLNFKKQYNVAMLAYISEQMPDRQT